MAAKARVREAKASFCTNFKIVSSKSSGLGERKAGVSFFIMVRAFAAPLGENPARAGVMGERLQRFLSAMALQTAVFRGLTISFLQCGRLADDAALNSSGEHHAGGRG
jgi:hypothetical protein